jgi:hypothetical protein
MSYASPPSAASVPSAASQASASTIAAIIAGAVFGFVALFLTSVAWQKRLWCFYKHRLQRSNSVRIERQPAYAPAVQPVGPIQLQ